jgi:hypothetical protein
MYNVSHIRQIKLHTAELLGPCPSPLEAEIAFAKLKKCKLPGSDHILAEVFPAGGETLVHVIYELINSIWN